MDARGAFAAAVDRDDEEIDVARAALLFAAVEYDGLDVDAYLRRLDRMADELRPRIGPRERGSQRAATVAAYLFGEQAFAGNELDYYDPRNSYLNQVLDRRLGIPISLSVVYIELGRRLDIQMDGVGMPGHFLVRYQDGLESLLIDPFNRGAVVTREDCQQRLRDLYGDAIMLTDEMLRPVGKRSILYRMLTNLKLIYSRQHDLARAIRTVDLLLLVEPGAVTEYRDRGLLRYRGADFKHARADLAHYLEIYPDAPDAARVREQHALIERLESMRN